MVSELVTAVPTELDGVLRNQHQLHHHRPLGNVSVDTVSGRITRKRNISE